MKARKLGTELTVFPVGLGCMGMSHAYGGQEESEAIRTLHRAVESIVQQSFRNWELILVDNNADAATKAIAERWVEQDLRVKLIHESHQGVAHALNNGLKNVRTKYVARMDADDVSHPDRLQLQFDFLEQHPEIGLVACRCAAL